VIVQGFGGYYLYFGSPFSNLAGGTNRYNGGGSYAQLAFNEASTTTTFTASASSNESWAGIATTFSGGTLNDAPIPIVPVNYGAQTALTGATTLYITLARAGGSTATVSATTIEPALYIVPVPA
jgi:hypothetical protein